jgi:hypothetical protein
MAIRAALHGRAVPNRDSLANPQALDAMNAEILSGAF